MSKSFYKNLVVLLTAKHTHGNWHNKLFRHVCKNIIRGGADLADAVFPRGHEVVEQWDLQDIRKAVPNKKKARSWRHSEALKDKNNAKPP